MPTDQSDELSRKLGAWGGDRKLSPRYPSLVEIEMRRARRRDILIETAMILGGGGIALGGVFWVLLCR